MTSRIDKIRGTEEMRSLNAFHSTMERAQTKDDDFFNNVPESNPMP
jgi:hypothetical protein